jgi:hypothetical protein
MRIIRVALAANELGTLQPIDSKAHRARPPHERIHQGFLRQPIRPSDRPPKRGQDIEPGSCQAKPLERAVETVSVVAKSA